MIVLTLFKILDVIDFLRVSPAYRMNSNAFLVVNCVVSTFKIPRPDEDSL